MDDLGQVLRDLNGKAISHHVTYSVDPDDGRANFVWVEADRSDGTTWLAADFQYSGTHWNLTRGATHGRIETLTGLLASIEEA